MFSLYRTLSLRYLQQHWFRAVLVVMSIALGVAMLVATQALNRSIAQAGSQAVSPMAGAADLQINNDDAGVHKAVLDLLRQSSIPGVRLVVPLVLERGALPKLNNRVTTLVGVEQDAVKSTDSPWQIKEHLDYDMIRDARVLWDTRLLVKVYVGSELAREFSSGPVPFVVRVAGKEHQVVKYGTVEAHGAAAMLSGNVLYMSLADAAQLVGRPEYVTRIDVYLQPDADRQTVRDRLTAVLAGQAKIQDSDASGRAYQDVLKGLEVGFKLGGVIALVVGLFLVYNALSVTVAERRHDIGILRSMGATRRQVRRLFITEATILGLTGAAIGVPLGWGLALMALGPIQHAISDIFIPLHARPVEITTGLVFAAIVAGVLTAVLAALVPAIQASSEEPADAVRRVPQAPGWVFFVLQLSASTLLLTTGGTFMACREHLPQRAGTYGGVLLVLVGTLVSAPLLTTLAARLIGPLFRHFLGIEGRLAADNLIRSPGRTGLVIAAVAAVIALILQTAGLIVSSEKAIVAWVEESMVADVFVTANSPLTSSGQGLPMPEALGKQIAGLPGVKAALPERFKRCQFREKMVYLTSLDAREAYRLDRERSSVPWLALYPRLVEPGKVLVSENFCQLYDVAVGDTFTLQGPRGPIELHVLGTTVDYSWNRGTIFMDRGQYSRQFDDDLVDVFYVYLRDNVTAKEVEEFRETVLKRYGSEFGLVALTREELQNEVRSLIRRLYSVAYAQEFIIGLVAALGVVTALLISVLQRRRELGLLRAVGATQPQIVRSVLAEAVLMGMIGSLIGLVLGLPLEWFVVRVVLLEDAGFSFPVQIPWLESGILLGLTLVIAILAGLGPALHAMRLHIAEAIAYE